MCPMNIFRVLVHYLLNVRTGLDWPLVKPGDGQGSVLSHDSCEPQVLHHVPLFSHSSLFLVEIADQTSQSLTVRFVPLDRPVRHPQGRMMYISASAGSLSCLLSGEVQVV